MTSVSVDLIYRRICGSVDLMTFDQFLDAIVQLSLMKYPSEIDPQGALFRLYNDRLSSFSSPDTYASLALDASVLRVFECCQVGLITLYRGYFPHEVNANFVGPFSSVDSLSKRGFVELFTDYEVCASLLDKPALLSIYRSVTTSAFLLTGLDTVLADIAPDSIFTFRHFCMCALFIARKVFPSDNDAARVAALFVFMDRSRGRSRAKLKMTLPDKKIYNETLSHKKSSVQKPSEQNHGEDSASTSNDVATAVLTDVSLLECLSHFELGIQAQFHHYSDSTNMCLDGFLKFLSANELPEYRAIFQRVADNDEMNLAGFRLAIVLVANEFANGASLKDKLVATFEHINKVAGS